MNLNSQQTENLFISKYKASDVAILTKEEYRLLAKAGLVQKTLDGEIGWMDELPQSGECPISAEGYQYRQSFLRYNEVMQLYRQQTKNMDNMARDFNQQIALLTQQVHGAEKDALFARIMSAVSLIVSIVAIIVPLLYR